MAVNPAPFGFSAEYRGDQRAYDGLDEFLRIEFPKQHPGWEPRFGQATWFDATENRHDFAYLISGSVPEAKSHIDAEHKVAELLEEMARGFKKFKPELEKVLPKPITKVWLWH